MFADFWFRTVFDWGEEQGDFLVWLFFFFAFSLSFFFFGLSSIRGQLYLLYLSFEFSTHHITSFPTEGIYILVHELLFLKSSSTNTLPTNKSSYPHYICALKASIVSS